MSNHPPSLTGHVGAHSALRSPPVAFGVTDDGQPRAAEELTVSELTGFTCKAPLVVAAEAPRTDSVLTGRGQGITVSVGGGVDFVCAGGTALDGGGRYGYGDSITSG